MRDDFEMVKQSGIQTLKQTNKNWTKNKEKQEFKNRIWASNYAREQQRLLRKGKEVDNKTEGQKPQQPGHRPVAHERGEPGRPGDGSQHPLRVWAIRQVYASKAGLRQTREQKAVSQSVTIPRARTVRLMAGQKHSCDRLRHRVQGQT